MDSGTGEQPTAEQIERLLKAAWAARRNAYTPYSRFKVGAAILTSTGEIVAGCNVENVSFGLTNCAERTAVFAARAAGKLGSAAKRGIGGGPSIVAVAVVGRGTTPPSPCGACRQVLNEFGPRCTIICENLQGVRLTTSLAELLPIAFGPWD